MIEFDAQIEHHFGAGIYIRKAVIPARHFVVSHMHEYDHFGILASGSVIVSVDGEHERFDAPAVITIKAMKAHSIEAVTNVTWLCVHATNETSIDDIDAALIRRVA